MGLERAGDHRETAAVAVSQPRMASSGSPAEVVRSELVRKFQADSSALTGTGP